jgi:hypothetical protein
LGQGDVDEGYKVTVISKHLFQLSRMVLDSMKYLMSNTVQFDVAARSEVIFTIMFVKTFIEQWVSAEFTKNPLNVPASVF